MTALNNQVETLPSALARRREIARMLSGKRVAIFLDYDGTLTPIVARPDLAVLSEDMRATIKHLGNKCVTAIVSGRSLADVEKLVMVDDIYYAGNHGFEISGPDRTAVKHEKGVEYLAAIDEAHQQILERVRDVKGVIVEHKKFSLSVHYRLAAEEQIPGIESAVDQVLERHPNLRKHHGKKVFEVRPRIDWDKGKAVLWLMQALKIDSDNAVAIYVGDDVTDEDAFRALRDRGIGILVTDRPRESAARYVLRDTGEVKQFLEMLATLMENGTS